MDLDRLSDSEVFILVKSLKKLKKDLNLEITNSGKIKRDEQVMGIYDGIEYKLHLYRNPIEERRYSIHLRFTENNHHLIRIDVNNGTHRNPDGIKIVQNHFHLYKFEEGLRRDAYAYPLDCEADDLISIFTAFEKFLEYNSIIKAKWKKVRECFQLKN